MRKLNLFLMLAVSHLTLTACYMEVGEPDSFESDYYYEDDGAWITETIIIPNEIINEHDQVRSCKDESNEKTPYCMETDKQKWKTQCRGEKCNLVRVQVHYDLDKDIGQNLGVVVEAFDNQYFTGYPVATASLSQFDGSRPGERAEAKLFLPTGSFYLRSYVARKNQAVVPFSYQDMEVVADQPMGVYGAISQAQSLEILEAGQGEENIDIYINQLFTKPGTEPEIFARARLKIKSEGIQQQDIDRNIVIQFLDSTDIHKIPTYEFTMNSSTLLVEGKNGQTEFVTPNLMPGKYVVFVYIDRDGNGFYDEGEFAQASSVEGSSSNWISVEKNRTGLLSFELSEIPDIEQ